MGRRSRSPGLDAQEFDSPAGHRFITIKNYSNMVTMKFSATKSETLFLTPTIAVEQDNSETAIRFALWHGVFSVEVSKSYKTVKAK